MSSITPHPRLRERLGMDHEGFAEYLGSILGWQTTAAAVAHWEEEGIPPPADVLLVAAMAAQGVPGGDVLTLPMTASAERQAALMSAISPTLDESKGVRPYADRGLVGRAQWNDLIARAHRVVWLYGMAEHGYATDDEVPDLMQAATARGCEVRVLLLSPDYPGIEAIDADEGCPPGTLAVRIRASAVRFARMREECRNKLELRAYDTHPTASVIRGDDSMLVTPYLRYFAGSNSPTFEFAADSASKMFARYERHFISMWAMAREWA